MANDVELVFLLAMHFTSVKYLSPSVARLGVRRGQAWVAFFCWVVSWQTPCCYIGSPVLGPQRVLLPLSTSATSLLFASCIVSGVYSCAWLEE